MMGGSTTPKRVEQFPDINKLCNVASCWIYIGILLGVHPFLHIGRIRVKISLASFLGLSTQEIPWRKERLVER
jgi:hypothetical protein